MEIITFRGTSPKFLDQFKCFYDNVFVENFPKGEVSSFETIISNLKINDENFTQKALCIMKNHTIIGMIIYDIIKKQKSVMIEYIVVDKKHRGKGLGNILLQNVIKETEKMFDDKYHIFLETHYEKNLPQINLYRKSGFKIVKNLKYIQPPVENGEDYIKNMVLLVKTNKEVIEKKILYNNLLLYFKKTFCTIDFEKYIDKMLCKNFFTLANI